MRARRLLPWGMFVLMEVVLISLGVWQIHRKTWKENLLARIESRIHRAPIDITRLPPNKDQNRDYTHAFAFGVFRHTLESLVYWIGPQGAPGYHVITPLIMPSGHALYVDRGWVPEEKKDPSTRLAGQVLGPVRITGLVRTPKDTSTFACPPPYFHWAPSTLPDRACLAQVHGFAQSFSFFLEADATPNPGGLPVGGQTRLSLPNNHLAYALQWWTYAGILALIFTLYLRRQSR